MEELEILLEKGVKANDEEKSIEIYHQILSEKEDWSNPHYNLGLIYKYRTDWELSFTHNQRAVELEPEDEAAQWNLGIAATMLGKWIIARKCWNFFGMKYEIINEDTLGDIGIIPVRINPNSNGEIIWSRRVDPARSILNNIPYPESNHRYGDLVLNDGAPNGEREWNGKTYSVLDEIQLLKKSEFNTFSIKCNIKDKEHFKLLEERCEKYNIKIENWTTSVRMLCRKCSEGKPHQKHDHELESIIKDDENLIAFASDSEEILSELLHIWSIETKNNFVEYTSYHKECLEITSLSNGDLRDEGGFFAFWKSVINRRLFRW